MSLRNHFWILIFWGIGWLGAQNPQTNQQIVEQVCISALDSVCKPLLPDSAQVNLKQENSKGQRPLFLQNLFLDKMPTKGWRVAQAHSPFTLYVRVFDAAITYDEPAAAFLGFGREIRRRITVHLEGRLQNQGTGLVLKGFVIRKELNDRIKFGQIAQVEKSPYFFMRGRMRTYSRWSRYVEPAVVLGSLAVMIYLFFSVRF